MHSLSFLPVGRNLNYPRMLEARGSNFTMYILALCVRNRAYGTFREVARKMLQCFPLKKLHNLNFILRIQANSVPGDAEQSLCITKSLAKEKQKQKCKPPVANEYGNLSFVYLLW